jgi:hemerythrin-like metal-binding protein
VDEERDDAGAVDLGVEMLDAEHKGQLERMEELESAIRDGAARPELSARLDELVRFLEAHFMSEQIAMREHAYPAYEAHVREHEDAIELLRDLEARCSRGDAEVAVEILAALRGWLVSHIHTTDHSLAEFMKTKGVELH